MISNNNLLGGLYGLLIGDACGVPYEFRSPDQIPESKLIDMVPPQGYNRAWDHIRVGTYSDDGAQALCLLDTLAHQTRGPLNVRMLESRLIDWMNQGYMSVDRDTFDVGNRTGAALRSLAAGGVVDPLNKSQFCGNGSLMRSLPLALWHSMDNIPLVRLITDAAAHSRITHPYIRNELCVVLYTVIAALMLEQMPVEDAISQGIEVMRLHYRNHPQQDEVELVIAGQDVELTGSGYVVDSLWSSLYSVLRADSYEDAIKYAIGYGNDTDTTACITGGLAGILFGFSNIPPRWVDQLRGKDEWINPLVARLLLHHSV